MGKEEGGRKVRELDCSLVLLVIAVSSSGEVGDRRCSYAPSYLVGRWGLGGEGGEGVESILIM